MPFAFRLASLPMVAFRSLHIPTGLQGTGLPASPCKMRAACIASLRPAALKFLTLVSAAFLSAGPCAAVAATPAPTSPEPSGGFCAPPALGAPCSTGGLATAGSSEPLPGLAVGNPVHLATGNKYQLEVDLPPNPSAPGLELVRHYNGLSTQAGVLGRNWALSYDTQLRRQGRQWWLIQADGSRREISAPLPVADGHLWAWPDGRQLRFDAAGRLVRMSWGPHRPSSHFPTSHPRQTSHHSLHIERHTGPNVLVGLVKRVRSSSGHSLEFHYQNHGSQFLLQAVDTPLGRFTYQYELPDENSGHRMYRLVSVTRPDGMQRIYHHEPEKQSGNPYALTGVSLRPPGGQAHRLASWHYDHYGRVVSLYRHGRDKHWVHIDYVSRSRGRQAGLTRLTWADGTSASIHHARLNGEYRLLGRHTNPPGQGDIRAEYDARGRLLRLGEIRLERAADGSLRGLTLHEAGWPGLRFRQEPEAARLVWHSNSTGATSLEADAIGRPVRLQYASGHTVLLTHDAQGRPVRLEHVAPDAGRRIRTRLQWHGLRLQRIEHPHETETLEYDEHGRLSQRYIWRPAAWNAPAISLRESFSHDSHGRLTRHTLPEGGALLYTWRDSGSGRRSELDSSGGAAWGRLAALHWEDPQGRLHTVIESDALLPGYRYGNGLHMVSAAVHGPDADTLVLSRGNDVLWRQGRQFGERGQVLQDTHEFPGLGVQHSLRFQYDGKGRMVAARQADGPAQWWYAWNADGSLAAGRMSGVDHLPPQERDASGLPKEAAGFSLEYGPNRRLESLSDSAGRLAEYRHNAFGHRIAKRVLRGGNREGAEGKGAASGSDKTVHYLYLSNRLVAEAQLQNEAFMITRRYLYAGHIVVGMIDYMPGRQPALYAVHTDLSGVPRLLTDQNQNIRWLAGYTPTGQALQEAGDLSFPLRFPGQYEDTESGWHDNLLRTYLPAAGQYLEPDPTGPLPGTQVYGYAAQQPWRFADPHGLLLFAFDGTRYSADTESNAWLLAQAYRDGPSHYHAGPGNSHYLDWDAIVAWRAGQILENQWQALLASLENHAGNTPVPIDIIGFSRGAALARHFGNRIAAHVNNNGLFSVDDPLRGRVSACVDLRFMGLFDSVAQFGIAGSHNHLYDFAVSEMWSWVAHAVALHEHRWAFPLLSADAGDAGNVVEMPFVGAHADIGGGIALLAGTSAAESEDSDLAKVALAWMHWQARAASVSFDGLEEDSLAVQAPFLRDMRSPLIRTIQRGDRAIQAPSGALRLSYQDDDPKLGRTTREQTEAFIKRAEDWRRQDGERVGEVDMEAYALWLEATLGWSP